MKKAHKVNKGINLNHLHAKGLIAVAILLILVAIPAFNTSGNVAAGCHDTDGGLNYYIKGSVNVGSSVRTDYCIGEKVAEFYCEAGEARMTIHECPKYCVGGRCVE